MVRVDRRKLTNELEAIDEVVRHVKAGDFDPKQSERCPSCPYYFICPATGATV